MKSIVVFLAFLCLSQSYGSDKVLLFTKTEDYRHESIETGVKAITKLGKQNGFDVLRYFYGL